MLTPARRAFPFRFQIGIFSFFSRSLLALCLACSIVSFSAWPGYAGNPNFLPVIRPNSAQADLAVYADSLASGWQDWSWGATVHFNNTSLVHSGSYSIAITYTGGWQGFQLGRNAALDASGYNTLRFYVNGGAGPSKQFQVTLSNSCTSASQTVNAPAGAWTQVDIPLSSLDKPYLVSTIQWFNNTPNSQGVFYLDDIAFVQGTDPAPLNPQAGPGLSVDAAASRYSISPYIYGMNFPDEGLATELHLPVARWGGNGVTRYNWQNDTSNHASDWYFENLPNDNPHPELLPNGSSSDRFVEANRRSGTDTLLTVPLIGWTPKSRQVACGFSHAKYGDQQNYDPWQPDCGDGVGANGSDITGNDPHDTSVEITPTFVTGWMDHLILNYGTAGTGGVRFYNLDNEPMLWNSTHRDVHPMPTSYDEMKQRTVDYASAIKATDPQAQTLGPVLWGWTAYFYSALDAAAGGNWVNSRPDRKAHGDIPFVPWYLQQMQAYQEQHGTRILDFLDLHYYPQGSGVFSDQAGDANTQALRLRSTRSLWDASYADESWINQTGEGPYVRLIPRMKDWVNANYLGTKLAISEYSWGAMCHISGALAEADVLGVFGREGLDLATLWGPPASNQPGAYAFRMYLNYNGFGAKFGETEVQAASADQDKLAIYAAQRGSDGVLTMMVINKTNTPLTSSLSVTNFTSSNIAQVYRYDKDNPQSIQHLTDLNLGGTLTFKEESITLLILPVGGYTPQNYIFLPLIRR